MLRDTDIFVIQYTLDYVSNNRRGLAFPQDADDLWPVNKRAGLSMLDSIDLALEQSAFTDPPGRFAPHSSDRTNFIIDETFDYMARAYGLGYALKDERERTDILSSIRREFENHQHISTRFPKGEPFSIGSDLTFIEETKLDSETKYDKTRIYQRVE